MQSCGLQYHSQLLSHKLAHVADYDSPRWRRCPLELVHFQRPVAAGSYMHALDDHDLLEKLFWLLLTDDRHCIRDIIALSLTCTRFQ